MDRENLADLVNIIVILRNRYGIQPFSVSASSRPAPTKRSARCMLKSAMLNKLMNLLLDTPRLSEMSVHAYGYPRPTEFELVLTFGD
jgi:hypothetical protein